MSAFCGSEHNPRGCLSYVFAVCKVFALELALSTKREKRVERADVKVEASVSSASWALVAVQLKDLFLNEPFRSREFNFLAKG